METISFMIGCRRFFGMKPEQKLAEFATEVKQLTPVDRAEMAPMLAEALGIGVVV